MRKLLIITFSFIILTFSCEQKNTVFSESFTIPKSTWDYDSLIQFKVNIKNINEFYQIRFRISHHQKYAFSNLWIKFIVIAPDSNAIIDTINILLQDQQHRWLGKAIGKNWSLEYIYADSIKFRQIGVYNFLFQHIMRPDELKYINKIGITIKKN